MIYNVIIPPFPTPPKKKNINKQHTVVTFRKSNRKIIHRDKIVILSTCIHFRALGLLSMKTVQVNQVVRAKLFPSSEMMRSMKCFPHASKLPTLAYNCVSRCK